MSEEIPEITLFGIDIVGEEHIKDVLSCLKSPAMRDLCNNLFKPALNKIAHTAILLGGEEQVLEAGRYDLLHELIDIIQD